MQLFRKSSKPTSGMMKIRIATTSKPSYSEVLSALLFVVVTGALILKAFTFTSIETAVPGEVATEDIYATVDLNIPDTATTEARRREAMENAPRVYSYDPRAREKVMFIVDEIFQQMQEYHDLKQSLAVVAKKEGKKKVEEEQAKLDAEYQEKLQSYIPPTIFVSLKEVEGLDQLLPTIKGLLDRLYTREFVEDSSELTLKNGEAVLFDAEKEQEYLTKGFPPVIDRGGLRQFVYNYLRNQDIVHDEYYSIVYALVNHVLIPNYAFDRGLTQANKQKAADAVENSYLRKKTGEVIVRKGERISQTAARFVNEQNERLRSKISFRRIASTLLLLLLTVFFMFRLSAMFQRRYQRESVSVFMVLIWAALAGVVIMKLLIFVLGAVERTISLSVLFQGGLLFYSVPYAFPAALSALLCGGIPALIVTVTLAIAMLLLTAGNIPLVVFLMFSSFAAIHILRKQSGQAGVLLAGFWLGLAHFVFLTALYMHYTGAMSWQWYPVALGVSILGGFLVSSLVAVLLPTFETAFGITTDIRLLELANMNNRLLVNLSLRAPGTYQHSIFVANLVEAAAKSIGANGLLARVGTYYHDIGKMEKAGYFVENLRPGEENRHERLTPKMSAIVLTNHVKDGVKLAQEAKLPEQVMRFIREHHGTKLMAFFYNKALTQQEENGETVEETDYRYPGPKPTMKETAILMIGDAVEAASRTLKAPVTVGKLQNVVNRIIKDLIDDNQFSDCDLTFRELDIIADSFLKSLAASFHTRIDYPGYDFNENQATDANGDESEEQEQGVKANE